MKFLLHFFLMAATYPAMAQRENTPCGETVPSWFLCDKQAQWRHYIYFSNEDSTVCDLYTVTNNIIEHLRSDTNARYLKYNQPELLFLLTNFEIDSASLNSEMEKNQPGTPVGRLQFQVSILFDSTKISISITDIHSYRALFEEMSTYTRVWYDYSSILSLLFKDKGCLKNNKKGKTTKYLKEMDRAFSSYFYNLYRQQCH